MNIQKIRALSFDLDDTLWPIAPTLVGAEAALRDWFSRHAPKALSVYEDSHQVASIREGLKLKFKDQLHDLSAIRQALIREVLVLAGEPTHGVQEAFEVFFQARQTVHFYPDVLPALRLLSAKFPIAALTNGNANIQQVGLGAYFTHAISAQDFGVSKPDPKIFHHTLNLLGVEPEEMLHIGDDVHTDVGGAREAKIPCVWVRREEQAWTGQGEPPHSVRDLNELVQILC